MRLDPTPAEAYYGRGTVYLNQGDDDKAIAEFTEAIGLDPTSADAYNRRGFAYANLEEYDKAIADYNKAIRLDPRRSCHS